MFKHVFAAGKAVVIASTALLSKSLGYGRIAEEAWG